MPSILDSRDMRNKAAKLARIAARLDDVGRLPLLDSGLTEQEALALDSEGLIQLVSSGPSSSRVYELWEMPKDGLALARLWETRPRNVFVRFYLWSVSRIPTLAYDALKIVFGVVVGWYLKSRFGA